MDRLTIMLTVVNRSESEDFASKAAEALAHVAALPEFKEGTYDPGYTIQAPNGVTVRADYKLDEDIAA